MRRAGLLAGAWMARAWRAAGRAGRRWRALARIVAVPATAARAWAPERVALALTVGGLLLGAALIGGRVPVLAQEAESGAGIGIRFNDLSDTPTHTTVDRFTVEVSNLSADATYQVSVSSDASNLGIDACGTTSQTRTVTGATAHSLTFILYVCAVESGTITAEVRQSGADTAAASVSRSLTVIVIPDGAPAGVRGAPAAQAGTVGPTQVGTPGIVEKVTFPDEDRTSTSVKATWTPPSDGGRDLTGYGVLLWREVDPHPPWDKAVNIGVKSEHTFTGLQPSTKYKFRIHACNGTDSCGYWTHPPIEVTTLAGTPTPLPTSPTQSPPEDRTPSFGTVSALRYNFVVGYPTSLLLPAASGGDGVLTYRLEKALGNGLTFDGATRTVAGTPKAAANLATYTYTAIDADKDTAQIPFIVAIFDVDVVVVEESVYKPLKDSTWSVLGDASVVPQEKAFDRTDGAQLQLQLPASTGFQVGRQCNWTAPPTGTTMLESPWVRSNVGFFLVRCGLGSGAKVRIQVKVRWGGKGTGDVLYTAEMTIKQAWHQHDRKVTYYIRGSGSGGTIKGVTDSNGEGLFPAPPGTPTPTPTPTRTPDTDLTTPVNYENAGAAWANVITPTGGVTFKRVTSAAGADVVIAGYWEAERSAGGKCSGIACVHPGGTYPHLSNEKMFIEERPKRTGKVAKDWTTEFSLWDLRPNEYEYLPAVLMHEFGHNVGLDDNEGEDIMSGRVRELEPCSPNTEDNRCGLFENDKEGVKAIYANHTTN